MGALASVNVTVIAEIKRLFVSKSIKDIELDKKM